MKNILITALYAIILSTFIGCDNNDSLSDNQGIPDITNGRITIVNDEAKLNSRTHILSDTISVEAGGLPKSSGVMATSLVLEAEIDPPVINGVKLQATSVSLKDNFAYISYNVRGESYAGAIDIVQIKGTKNATIRSQAQFNDTKVSAVYFDPTTSDVYLAQASGNTAFNAPAAVEKIGASGNKLNLSESKQTVLSSYAATSVFVKGNTVYTTTGNTGGLYTMGSDLTQTSYTAISDARWVDVDENYIAVVQGGGKVTVLNASSRALINTYSFTGTSIPESKSTVQIIGGKALIAAGDGGVVVMNLATGKVVGSLPRTIVAGLDPSVTVTNAVAADENILYLSNGEAGVYQAVTNGDINLKNATGDNVISLTVQGKLKFKDLQSVNHVAFDGSTLVVASGLGGVKIVSVKK